LSYLGESWAEARLTDVTDEACPAGLVLRRRLWMGSRVAAAGTGRRWCSICTLVLDVWYIMDIIVIIRTIIWSLVQDEPLSPALPTQHRQINKYVIQLNEHKISRGPWVGMYVHTYIHTHRGRSNTPNQGNSDHLKPHSAGEVGLCQIAGRPPCFFSPPPSLAAIIRKSIVCMYVCMYVCT